jgi:hypothetical protein
MACSRVTFTFKYTLMEANVFYAQMPDHERDNCFLQQHGATCHMSRDSMAEIMRPVLNGTFCIIYRYERLHVSANQIVIIGLYK